jgi:hypothetical protein
MLIKYVPLIMQDEGNYEIGTTVAIFQIAKL